MGEIQRRFGIPIKFVGLGETAEDLDTFDPERFVAGLLGAPGDLEEPEEDD